MVGAGLHPPDRQSDRQSTILIDVQELETGSRTVWETLDRRLERRLLVGILAVALLVRIAGCFGQGLPFTFYKDEENNVERALALGAQRSLDPGWFNKPALGYYVLLFEYGVYYAAGRLTGSFASPEDFGAQFYANPGPFYLIGRITASLSGVLGVLAVYWLGRRVRDGTTGLVAALALTFALGHVSSSQEVKMDVPAALFTTVSALYLLRILETGRTRDYVLAGLFAGLGTATKYYSVALFPSFVFAHLFRHPLARVRSPRRFLSPQFGLGILAYFGGFFGGSPYNFLSSRFLDERVLPQLRFTLGRFGLALPGNSASEIKRGLYDPERHDLWDALADFGDVYFAVPGMGPLLAALSIIGLVACCARLRRGAGSAASAEVRAEALLVLTTVVFAASIVMANQQFPEPRHLSNIYPFAAVLAALGFAASCRWVCRLLQRGPVAAGAATLGFAALLLVPAPGMPAWAVLENDLQHLARDPRLRVMDWLEDHVPAGSVVINDKEWLPLATTTERCEWMLDRIATLKTGVADELAVVAAREDPASKAHGIRLRKDLDDLEKDRQRWEIKRLASLRHKGPAYDVLVFDHVWSTEQLNLRDLAALAYDKLWPQSPWGRAFGEILAEARASDRTLTAEAAVERFRERLSAMLSAGEGASGTGISPENASALLVALGLEPGGELALVELWRRVTPVSEEWLLGAPGEGGLRPVEWFVSPRVTYQNYLIPSKRANFPDWAAFYDDLVAHYDAYDFHQSSADHEKAFRVWDLRRRVHAPIVRRVF